jgi:hypothetical protein
MDTHYYCKIVISLIHLSRPILSEPTRNSGHS